MSYLRLLAVSLMIAFGLGLAACSTTCKSDTMPAYPDSGKTPVESGKDVQK
jgi:hypothetical protein